MKEKPPLGVIPERFWKEDRLKALDAGILKRIEIGWKVPLDLLIERNRLLAELNGMRVI